MQKLPLLQASQGLRLYVSLPVNKLLMPLETIDTRDVPAAAHWR